MKDPSSKQKYASKEGEKTYFAWLVRSVVEAVVLVALVLGGIRAIGATG